MFNYNIFFHLSLVSLAVFGNPRLAGAISINHVESKVADDFSEPPSGRHHFRIPPI